MAIQIMSEPPPEPALPGENAILTEREMREFARNNIIAALKESNWRVSGEGGAAEILDVRPTTLADRIKAFDIRKPGR